MNEHVMVIETMLEVGDLLDHRAPGGAVTAAICGNWDHAGPCRWPHNNSLDISSTPVILRTVVVVEPEALDEVRATIEGALAADPQWTVVSCQPVQPSPDHLELGHRMASAPRRE